MGITSLENRRIMRELELAKDELAALKQRIDTHDAAIGELTQRLDGFSIMTDEQIAELRAEVFRRVEREFLAARGLPDRKPMP